jgi:hypothetical protein
MSIKITLIIWALLVMMTMTTFSSCAPHRAVITTQGQVIDRYGDTYLILWRDLADKPYSYAYNWVYQPGLLDTPIDQIKVSIIIDRKEGNDGLR